MSVRGVGWMEGERTRYNNMKHFENADWMTADFAH